MILYVCVAILCIHKFRRYRWENTWYVIPGIILARLAGGGAGPKRTTLPRAMQSPLQNQQTGTHTQTYIPAFLIVKQADKHPKPFFPAFLNRLSPTSLFSTPPPPVVLVSFKITHNNKVDTNILNVDMAALGNAAPYATGDPTICSGCRACLSAVSVLTPVPNTPTTTTTAAAAAATAAGNQSSGAGKGGASLKFSSPLLPSPATCGGGSAVAGGENANSGAKAEDDAEGEGRGDFVEGVYDWACEYCGEVNRVELDDMEKPIKGQDSVDYIVEMAPISTAVARSGKGADDDKV